MTREGFKRKLTAILSADVAGYSRLMGDDEEATVRTLTAYREVLTDLIQRRNGEVLDSPGDNLLAEFASVVDAVQCGAAIQKEIEARNDELAEDRRMQFRIGINLGDVIQEEGRIYGDGVNIAARLEGLADPGGICISQAAFDQVEGKLPYGFDYLGEQTVKNIAKPVGAYRVLMDPDRTSSGKPMDKKTGAAGRTPVLLAIAMVLVLAVAAGVWQLNVRRPTGESGSTQQAGVPSSGKPSIAVLPFDNMSGDPDQEYFSDGMTEEIIARLSTSPTLSVIARNSTFTYKGKPVKVQQIGRELGVRYVVEGSVRKAGNRIRITAQLIDAETEKHLWAKTYDRELKDVFNLQDEIAQQIVTALNIRSREAEQERAWRVPTENLTAYDFLLRGLSHFFRLTEEENAKAKSMFQRALELDPDYAAAYVFLGYTNFMEYAFGSKSDPRDLEQVIELAQKALALDDSSSLAHVLLADVYRAQGRYEQAVVQAERALALNPNDPSAYLSMANNLNSVGRPAEAVEAIKKAMDLNPHHAVYYYTDLARAYRNAGRYNEAIASLKTALARNPDWMPAYFELAMTYSNAWLLATPHNSFMLDRAVETMEKLRALDRSSAYGLFTSSLIAFYQKQYEKALAGAEKLISLDPESADSYALLGVIYNSMGRPEDATRSIEKAMRLNPEIPAWYLSTLATAQALSGLLMEAITTYKKVLDQHPSHYDAFQARLNLVVLYVNLGQEEAARAEAAELLNLVPGFSVEAWGQRVPLRNRAQIEKSMADLRKAGLK